MRCLALALALLASPAHAAIAMMENVNVTGNIFKADTTNQRVNIATSSYTGGIPNVGLHVGSNVVVDTLALKNACVIYATGSVTCLGVTLGAGGGGASTISVNWVHDDFIGSVNGSQKDFTLTQGISSGTAIRLVLDGLSLAYGTDFSFSAGAVHLTTAPAAVPGTQTFFADYTVNTSTLPGVINSGTSAGGSLTGTYPNPDTVGVTSSCATGYYWDTGITTKGRITGGSCAILPSAGETSYFAPSKTFGSSVTMKGVTDGSAASAGNVGEVLSVVGAVNNAIGASGSYVATSTLTLTAGDWDVSSNCALAPGVATVAVGFTCGLSTVNTSLDNTAVGGWSTSQGSNSGASQVIVQLQTGVRRFNVSGGTTIYTVASVNYSTLGGATIYGPYSYIFARRVR